MTALHDGPRHYGVLFQFDDPATLIEAARRARSEGFSDLETYSPYPIEGLLPTTRSNSNWLPWLALLGAIFGAVLGYGVQYYSSVVDYPLNVGGRSNHSWPAFLIVAFELALLLAAVSVFLGFFAFNRLPMPAHPLFRVPEFRLASQHSFFLCIRARRGGADPQLAKLVLDPLRPVQVWEVDQ